MTESMADGLRGTAMTSEQAARMRTTETRETHGGESTTRDSALRGAIGLYRRWGNTPAAATTIAAVGAEAILHADAIARAADALLDHLTERRPRSAPPPPWWSALPPDLQSRLNQVRMHVHGPGGDDAVDDLTKAIADALAALARQSPDGGKVPRV